MARRMRRAQSRPHHVEIALQVGESRKELLVTGDRAARFVEGGRPVFTDPSPFLRMDLRYELAYGGIDVYSNKAFGFPYLRNPLGRGFVVANSAKAVDRLSLPNLEDPDAPLTPEKLCVEDYQKWEEQPLPAGFGWFPENLAAAGATRGGLTGGSSG